MSLVKEGWIEKKGQTFMAGYKKRWLVLYSDKTLKYYEDKYYEILKGSVDISEATKVQYGRHSSKNWKFGWEIVTPTRIWHFASKTDHDRKQWIQSIQTAMEQAPAFRQQNRTLSYLNKALKNIAKELDTTGNKSMDGRKTASYNNIDEEDINDSEQDEEPETDAFAGPVYDHHDDDDDDDDDDEEEDDGYHPMETGEYGRSTIPMMTEYDFDGPMVDDDDDFFGSDDTEIEHMEPEPPRVKEAVVEKQVQIQIEKTPKAKEETTSTNPFKRKSTNPFEENAAKTPTTATTLQLPVADFDAAGGDTKSRARTTTEEGSPKKAKKGGLFSAAFGSKKNKSVTVTQTAVNSAKLQVEQNHKQKAPRVGGKKYNQTNRAKVAQMMNKQIHLSWRYHQEHRDDTKSDPAEEYHKCFSWRSYERKMRDLIKKNENNKHQFESHYELKCFCGARLCKTKCVQDSQRMICEFCGSHTLSDGAIYFECEDSHNEKNKLHEDDQGWKVCSMCAYNELLTKYYNPKLHGHKPRAVGMSVMVERVSDIDTANQSFRAKIKIKHSWKPSKEEVDLFRERPGEFEPFWMPQFEFANCIEVHSQGFKLSHWRKRYIILRRGESNGDHLSALPYVISGEYWIDATFSELFELEHFPVDCQDLTIKLMCKQFTQIAHFRTPLQGANLVSVYKEYAAISEWKIREPKFEIITKKNIADITSHSMLNISIKLQRIYTPYFWRMIIILMLLCAASLLSFTMDILQNNGVDRIAYLVTLLLIAVVYQHNIKQNLPEVWYLTLMDKYILCSFLFLFVILVQTTVLAKLSWDDQFDHWKSDFIEMIDSYSHYGFWAVFVCVHIVFVIVTLRAKQYEKHKLRCLPSDVDKYTHKRRKSSKLHKVHKFKLHSSEATRRKCLW